VKLGNLQQETIRASRWSALAIGILLTTTVVISQTVPVVTGDARVDKLLSQMTLEEKLTLIHGAHEDPAVYQGQAGYLAGIPRLNIPGLRFADGPPGVLTRHPSQAETATMGVAATFSIKDAEDNGIVIGREDRALGIDVSLQPFVNIVRDLEFGRAYNTFGEDPFLTSRMTVAYVKGTQGDGAKYLKLAATLKHYAVNNQEKDRTSLSAEVNERMLMEFWLPHFKAGIVEGRVINVKDVDALAALPSKEELISKLMFLLNSPAQRIATAVNGVARNLAVVIKQIADQKGAQQS